MPDSENGNGLTKNGHPRKRAPGAGRPRKELDRKQIRRMAGIGCTIQEMAAVLGVNRDTLSDNYSADIKEGQECGKSSLRRIQWKMAQKGNVAMAIWLGKQLLGQKDRSDFTSGDQPLYRKGVRGIAESEL